MENDYSSTVLDLFCGAGGFSAGFENAVYRSIAGVDIDESALETYRANIDAPGHNIDLSETSPEDLLDQIGVDADDIEIVTGGPPCQGFSYAGDRDPDDPRNALVKSYFDFIDYVRPSIFVMENVDGLKSMEDGEVLQGVEDCIEDIGYEYTFDVLNAADFGVPQTRKRFILIGSRDYPPTLPEPTHTDDWVPLQDILDCDGLTEDGETYLMTSPSGDSYQVHGRDPFRTTSEPAFTHTGRYARLIPPNFEPHEDATPAGVQHRRLTRQESARIQSFPGDYDWRGDDVMGQQGNAVPPQLAEAIARNLPVLMYSNLKAKLRRETQYPEPTTVETDQTDHGVAMGDD